MLVYHNLSAIYDHHKYKIILIYFIKYIFQRKVKINLQNYGSENKHPLG